MKEIAWGIIGCGDVTEVKSGPAFNKVPHSKLVAVMRRDGAKAEDYARRHRVPQWYADAEALLGDAAVNAIYIATPPAQHAHYTLRALQAGKPVYVEKPMALNAAEARSMQEEADRLGVKLTVAHYRRQQPLFLKVKSLLDEGAIGKVRTAQLQFSQLPHQNSIAQTAVPWRLDPALSGGGLFHDLAPHQLDLMRYFFGPFKSATGLATNTGGLYAVADTVSGQILFQNGVLFWGSWQFVANEHRDEVIIQGTEGSLTFSVFDNAPIALQREGTTENFSFDPLPHVQQPMIDAVVRCFRGEGENPCAAAEGVEVMEMMEAMG